MQCAAIDPALGIVPYRVKAAFCQIRRPPHKGRGRPLEQSGELRNFAFAELEKTKDDDERGRSLFRTEGVPGGRSLFVAEPAPLGEVICAGPRPHFSGLGPVPFDYQ
jgi:hypothetical protein